MKVIIFIGIVLSVLYIAKEGIGKGAGISSQSYNYEQSIKQGSEQ